MTRPIFKLARLLTSPLWGGRRAKRSGWGTDFEHRPPPEKCVAFFDLPTRGRLVLGVIFAICVALPAAAAPIKILAFGTSLTQGYGLPPGTEYPVVLEDRLKAAKIDVKVINAGVSGDTSAGGASRIDWSLADRPDAAIVELGSNDALRGLSPKQTEKNISDVLAKLKAAHVKVLLLGMKAPRNLGAEYAAEFDPIYPRLAKKYDVALYPFVLDGVALDPKLNQADGMHPNPAGVKSIVTKLLPYVKKLLGR